VYSIFVKRMWYAELAKTFVESHYVYNLKIIQTGRVVDNRHCGKSS